LAALVLAGQGITRELATANHLIDIFYQKFYKNRNYKSKGEKMSEKRLSGVGLRFCKRSVNHGKIQDFRQKMGKNRIYGEETYNFWL